MGVSEKALIEGDGVLEYIPQRRPVVMVDAFYGIEDDGVAVCGLLVTDDNLFCADGVMDECGMIEHMAQSAALRSGVVHRERGGQVPVAMIGAVSGLAIERNVCVGERMRTAVEVVTEVGPVALVETRSCVDGVRVCGCRFKIFAKE